MYRSARKVRQGLCADALFKLIRERCERLPDTRAVPVEISLADALLSAFAMFSLKDPSLLAFDQRRQDPSDNFRTVYGIDRVPCDSQMRRCAQSSTQSIPPHCGPCFRMCSVVCSVARRWNRSSFSTDITWCRSTARPIFHRTRCIVRRAWRSTIAAAA